LKSPPDDSIGLMSAVQLHRRVLREAFALKVRTDLRGLAGLQWDDFKGIIDPGESESERRTRQNAVLDVLVPRIGDS
jgi:hypothetical protein